MKYTILLAIMISFLSYSATDKNPYKQELKDLEEISRRELKEYIYAKGGPIDMDTSQDRCKMYQQDLFKQFCVLLACINREDAKTQTHIEFCASRLCQSWFEGTVAHIALQCQSSSDPDSCILKGIKQHHAWLAELYRKSH